MCSLVRCSPRVEFQPVTVCLRPRAGAVSSSKQTSVCFCWGGLKLKPQCLQRRDNVNQRRLSTAESSRQIAQKIADEGARSLFPNQGPGSSRQPREERRRVSRSDGPQLNLDAGRSVDRSLQYFLFVVVENLLMRNAASHEKRCSWVNMNDPLLVEYHDHEWGVPVHGDNRHLEARRRQYRYAVDRGNSAAAEDESVRHRCESQRSQRTGSPHLHEHVLEERQHRDDDTGRNASEVIALQQKNRAQGPVFLCACVRLCLAVCLSEIDPLHVPAHR